MFIYLHSPPILMHTVERAKKSGLPPGTLVHIGKKKTEQIRITVFDYDKEKVTENEVKKVEELFPFKKSPTVTWVNVDGLHQLGIIEQIGQHFELHPLLLEDIVNTEQRPKMELYGDILFLVLKMLLYDEKRNRLNVEQVSLVLGHNFILSFQEHPPEILGDVFDSVRERIRKKKFAEYGADYLLYALVDAIVDNYFVILERIGEKVEHTEMRVLSNSHHATLAEIHRLKQNIVFLRKSIWPLREVVNNLQRSDSKLIKKSTHIYFRDVHDHTVQVVDTIESFRDTSSNMLEIYLSGMSHRLNEVMKVLTIMGTIFIPLTFIASIYGMNFEFLPELHWEYGYFAVLGLMAMVSLAMVYYFKRKKWL